jgi:hypothetical protein
LLGILFGSEDGDSMFLWDVGEIIPDYTASLPTSQRFTVIAMRN